MGAPTARDLLLALIKDLDLIGFTPDGRAIVRGEIAPQTFAALVAFDADAPEDDEIDETAPDYRFFGTGCAG